MQLSVDISRLCLRLHKWEDFLQLPLVASLKSRRIVEDKPGVGLEYEWPVYIVYSSLVGGRGQAH